MCSARVDILHILKAFTTGNDAVFVGGCHLCDCHYVTNGNFNAFSMVQVFKKILKTIGIFPERLRIEWVSAGEGIRFANFMNVFSNELTALGPIGKAEGISDEELKIKFEAIKMLVPFLRLSITQRMLIQPRTEDAFNNFFTSKEFDELFDNLFTEKIIASQIMLLLKQKPRSTNELSQILKLNPSEISGLMNTTSRQGLVKYNTKEKLYENVLK